MSRIIKRLVEVAYRICDLITVGRLNSAYSLAWLSYRKHDKHLVKIFINKFFTINIFYGNKKNKYEKMFSKMKISINKEDFFVHSIDTDSVLYHKYRLMDNGAIDYELIINNSLENLKIDGNDEYSVRNNNLIESIIKYTERVTLCLDTCEVNNNIKENIKYISGMCNKSATNLQDALQRILIINQFLWQTGHRLIGLGRLDYILDSYIEGYSEDEIDCLVINFYKALHKFYEFKSSSLIGDTGQVIILGGKDNCGNNFENYLTVSFMKAAQYCKLPDPKILLRVSNETSENIWNKSIDCLLAKSGSPLFSNDDSVVPRLEAFGYDTEDCYGYTTSACWEPIVKNSFEQNNLLTINFLLPLIKLLDEKTIYADYEHILADYLRKLHDYVSEIANNVISYRFEEDQLLSSFISCCRDSRKDVTDGGLKYNNRGLLSVGLANAVNSLISIKENVFNNSKISLEELHRNLDCDFSDIKVRDLCRLRKMSFGKDSEAVIELSNTLISIVGDTLEECTNSRIGYKLKFGLSSPTYISDAVNLDASPDGRKKGQPLSVHISADGIVAPTELIRFASLLNYTSNGFNGNVIDYFISTNIVEDNRSEFLSLMLGATRMGFFQMQMNLIDSKTLIEAKKNPERFPNLIVRVWGFSAYFNDLPEEYQDYLIERAISSECIG